MTISRRDYSGFWPARQYETKPSESWHKHGMPFPIIIYPWLADELKKRGEWNGDFMIEQKPLPMIGKIMPMIGGL